MKRKRKTEMNEQDILKKALASLLGGMKNVPSDAVIMAQLNDNRLSKLAEYDVSKGYTDLKVENEQIQEKFCEFKNLVLKKSSTLAELETTVFSRWGVLEKPRVNSPLNQTTMPDLNDVKFSEMKPITGFATEQKPKQKGKKNNA
jgi:molybdenum cofactor biosynthesis enzyme MoaA